MGVNNFMNGRILNLLRITAWIQCLLGVILLSREIIDYLLFPTIQNIDNQLGGLVEWFKYKESCYKNFITARFKNKGLIR